MRALLALLVLLGMLPIQGGIGANTGRADSGQTVFFLDTGGGSNNLSLAAPSTLGSVILGRNMTANFTVGNFSGLYRGGLPWFVLNLSMVSLNFSGMRLTGRLSLDYLGNGSVVKSLPFLNYTTTRALETEHALIEGNSIFDHEYYGTDLRNGGLRLELARIDDSNGLLEVLCGSGDDQSSLSIPYGPPLRADAGPDRAAKANQTVALNASLSESADPAATEYLWNFGNGMTGSGDQVTISYNRSGNYTVTLTLRWNGLEATDTALINVTDNRPPIADAGLNVTKRAGENITFRGSGTDPDGAIVSFGWAFGDGFNASGQNVTHSFWTPGDYNVVLTVRDDGGAEGQDGLRVHINHPPRITNITAVRTGNLVSFQVTANDTDGTLLRYNWDFGDGTNGTGAGFQPAHRYIVSGTFTARCTVIDEYGDNATASVNITVENSAPVISSIGITTTTYVTNEPVRFRPTVTDADNDELTYSWNFGDGATSTDRAPTHYYPSAGTYTVTLRVSDGSAQAMWTGTIQVNEAAGAGLDPGILVPVLCIMGVVIVSIIVAARAAAAARKHERDGVQPPQHGETRYQPYGGLPAQTQPYGGAQPYGGVQTHPYGGAQYQPGPPRPARAPKAPPGVCPRCGSTDLQRFPDGHAKCINCKKIFFTG